MTSSPAEWQGYATDAAQAAIQDGFTRIGLNGIVAMTTLRNLDSIFRTWCGNRTDRFLSRGLDLTPCGLPHLPGGAYIHHPDSHACDHVGPRRAPEENSDQSRRDDSEVCKRVVAGRQEGYPRQAASFMSIACE